MLIGAPRRMRGHLYVLLPTYLDKVDSTLSEQGVHAATRRIAYPEGGENGLIPDLWFDSSRAAWRAPLFPADDQVFYGTSGSSRVRLLGIRAATRGRFF